MNKSKIWTLIKYFVSIDFFAILSIKQNLLKKGKKSAAFQGILALIVYLGLFIFLAPKLGKSLGETLTGVSGKTYLTTICVGLFIMTLFFSLANAFIFIEKNNESEMLLSLPISGKDIICSRIYALTITFFFSFYIMILIMLYVTGYYLKMNILYYVFVTIAMLLLNFEAVTLSGVIILLFGRLIRKSKFFNRFAKGIYSIFMIAVFGVYMLFTQSFSNPSIGVGITEILNKMDSTLSKIFFFVVWVKNIILFKSMNAVLINILIGILSCIVVLILFRLLANKNYLEILRSANVISKESSEVIEKRKQKGVASARQYKFMVLFKKEFNSIITTPTYLMQIIIIDIMLIIFAGIGVYFGLQYRNEVSFALNSIVSRIEISKLLLYSFGIGAIIGLFEGLSSLTTSSVSREGKSFWIIATAPIGIHTQVLSRIIACQFLHFTFLVVIMLASLAIYVFNPLVYVAFILGVSLTLFTSGALNMILGLISPNFDWKTPKEALNNGSAGLSVFASIIINYGIYGLMIFMFYFGGKRNWEIPTIILIDLAIVCLTGIISYILDYKLYKRVLKRL